MKKVLLTVAMVALIASPAFAIISGSAHDFSASGWTTDSQICQACHTPHGGDTTVAEAPLWNHAASVTTTYAQYNTTTLNAGDVATAPSGISALCLSCHDGATAMDAFGGAAGSVIMTGTAAITADTAEMANDHPVSFTYNNALFLLDSGLFDPAVALSNIPGTTGTISADMLFGASADQLECASCHDVHNGLNINKLLVKSNASSGLCLTCHNK